MNIKPLGERVLVEKVKGESGMVDGVYIPESKNLGYTEGVIVSAGDTKKSFVAGDKVLFEGEGKEVTVDGKKLYLVSEEKILASVEE